MLARVINAAAFTTAAFITIMQTASAANSPSSTATVPFSYVDNRMMVRCRLDGRGPFYMIVDTGAPDITITPETARQIGVAVVANGTMTGAGNRQVRTGSATITRLSIGSIGLSDFSASVVDLSEIRTKLGFPRLDGVIGYPIFKRFSTFVNVDAGTISFAAMPPRTPPFATSTAFTGTLPAIAGSIDGISTRIIVDTGDRSSLTLFGPFARAHGFYGRNPSRTNIVTGYGIGGPIRGDVFTIPSLDVLGRHLRGIVARASRQTGGVFTSADQGGSVGTGVLKRFNIVYDYADKRIIAWPSKYFRSSDRFSPPAAIGAEQAAPSDSDYIAKVMKGAPSAVVQGSTIIEAGETGKRTLQVGTNGFTCGLTSKGPVCADRNALAWMHAVATHTAPPAAPGFAYMLGGDSGSSNTEPDASAPTPMNYWMKTGPNVMIFGPAVKQMGYPMAPDADPTEPYVMWANTPYAHLMIPVTVAAQ